MRFAFILAEKAFYPISVLCAVLGVSPSGFYAWLAHAGATSARARDDERLSAEIAAAHARSRRTYGSPRVSAALRAQGRRVGRKRVKRLMRQRGLRGERKRHFRKTTDSRHDSPVAPNRLARGFTAEAPDRAWVTDVTAVRPQEGWLFVAVILDLFARRAVGWATSATNDTELARAALDRAVRQRQPRAGLLHHSDRGSPLRERALPRGAGRTRDGVEHEPQRRLLGQRRRRELLQHAQSRAHRARDLRDPRGGDAIDRRVHRRLLQR